MPSLTCKGKSTVKHDADDLVGITLGLFEVLVRVYNPGREGGNVYLDILKYYLSRFLRACVAQYKSSLIERLVV